MEIILLILSIPGYFVHSEVLHLVLLLLHYIGAFWIALRLLNRQPIAAFFVAVYALMFFTNPLGIILNLVDIEYVATNKIFFESNAMMMAGLDLFILGATRLRGNKPDFSQQYHIYLNNGPVELTIWVGTLVSFLSLVGIVVGGKAMGVDVFTIHKTYRTTGNQTYTYLIATYATAIMPLIFFLLANRKIGVQLTYSTALIALLVVYFMIFRNRTLPISCVIGYLVGVVARYRFLSIGYKPIMGRLPTTLVLVVLVSGPVLLLAGISLRYLRGAYQLQDYSLTSEHVQREIDHALGGGELGYAVMTREAMRLFPSEHPYLYGESYYRLLFTPIPREVWPDKPRNTNRLFAAVRDRELGRKGVTQSAGVVGTTYLNFGVLGVLFMVVIGFVFSFEKYLRLHNVLILATSGLWMIAIVRGSLTAPIVTFLFVYILARVFQYFAKPVYTLNPNIHRP